MTDPDAGHISLAEIEDWFFAESTLAWVPLDPPAPVRGARFSSYAPAPGWYCEVRDGPCSLEGIASALNLDASYIRRKVRDWRAGRIAGGTERLVPTQHDRRAADAA